ncbi:von Willebrand factor A domain-containing protein 3B [Chelonia mydas]|uniref:von Willebrand factor A domain-containing protein 3B n=1 Tax=Chelonia mydas TaxID=8469 RepID=M7BKC0_CHEMY|nr:von Willebrand factor A domain-containing protein 3B [Chelonia mydas]
MIGNLCKRVAWSDQVTFDMKHKREQEKSDSDIAHKGKSKEKERRLKSTLWDLDVQPLISSSQWLQCHGLKRNKLSLSQILSQIGFQHREDYVSSLGKFVASRYADGLFPQYLKAQDGRVYNLTAKKELILHFVDCLTGAIELYKQRMEWVTSESRQIFGVILESCITIVLDFGTVCRTEFDLCRDALSMVLSQQVAQLAKFNLIRTARDLVKWQQKTVPVSEYSVESAVKWLWKLDHMPAISHTCSTEALLEAIRDETVEAVYYFTVGDFPKDMKQLLLQKVSNSPYPIHTVSFNAKEEETILFLKEMSQLTSGRFHAFAERTDHIDIIGPIPKSEEDGESLATQNSRKLKGKVPLGFVTKSIGYQTVAGVREDVFMIWKESEEARNALIQLQNILSESRQPISGKVAGVREDVFMIWKESEEARNALIQLQNILSESHQPISGKATKTDPPVPEPKPEDYINSKEWLQKNGLKAQKLTLYEALADCTFRHADGVVDIKAKPEDESLQTDAETNKKIIHAKYCDKFVHTYWKDGSVVHVYVSTEKYRQYEEKMKNALGLMERRVKWLQRGSRGLFGNVLEDHIYILIDTSQSMRDKLPLVKEKIFQLIQEQLRHKSRFNFVKFDAQAVAWQEKLAEVNEENLQDAWLWIKELEVGSSTNTLKALQIALADSDIQAIYLLTDGRPDQPPKTILTQILLRHKVPIHTISFNCDDTEANKFLHELSTETGGRFHYYNIYTTDPEAPEPIVSEDIYLLKREIEQGERDLEKVQTFHTECLMMNWYNGEKDCENKHHKQTLTASSVTTHIQELNTSPTSRPYCASEEPLLTSHQRTVDVWQTRCDSPVRRKSALYADTSSAHWLKTHGLVARRLTIMDALAPTAIPHSTKYIPVLDKHVVSKVFDEVLPLAHVSNDKKRITLINPQAVNLDAYKEKLEQAIKSYERQGYDRDMVQCREKIKELRQVYHKAREAKCHSGAAPKTCRFYKELDAILGGDPTSTAKSPMNTSAGLEAAERRPNPEDEVIDEEVELDDDEELPAGSPGGAGSQELFTTPEVSSQSKQLLSSEQEAGEETPGNFPAPFSNHLCRFEQEEPVSYMEHKEALLQALENLGWPVSYDDVTLLEDEILAGLTYIQQASDLQEAAKKEIQRTSESHINHSKMKLTEENVKAQSKKRQKGKVFETLKGQKVIARSDITGFYFPGTVIKSISSSEALVDFSHGETQIVPIKFIIPVGGAIPCPSLQVGDYVFARTGTHTGNDYYMPAVVIATPKRVEADDKLYTVLKYNNRKTHCIRSGLIKISQTKYACSCRYIRMAHMVDCLL